MSTFHPVFAFCLNIAGTLLPLPCQAILEVPSDFIPAQTQKQLCAQDSFAIHVLCDPFMLCSSSYLIQVHDLFKFPRTLLTFTLCSTSSSPISSSAPNSALDSAPKLRAEFGAESGAKLCTEFGAEFGNDFGAQFGAEPAPNSAPNSAL